MSGDRWEVVQDRTPLRPFPVTWVLMRGQLSKGVRVLGSFQTEIEARQVCDALNMVPLAARLAEALRMQTPPPRRPGCWCHHARDVGRVGHAENCDRARDVLAAYAAANSPKKLESSSRVTSRGPEGAR